ncbi:MAG: hypothetical protein K0R28_1172, partial [Paenibacillus sp.]|nr:hypothetical protein [Paenibacillus sp.]
MGKKGSWVAMLVAAAVLVSGCGGREEGKPSGQGAEEKKEPFTMKIWGGGVTTKEFEERFR